MIDAVNYNAEIQQKVFVDCVSLLHRNLLMSIPANFLCASAVYIGTYGTVSNNKLWIWYNAVIVVSFLRLFLLGCYRRYPHLSHLHLNLFIIGTSVSAALWGVAGAVLMPSHDLATQMVVIVIIAGITAGGLQTLQASSVGSCIFMILAIFPLSVRFLMQTQLTYIALGGAIFIYLAFMLLIAQHNYQLLITMLKLQYENLGLVKDLSGINHRLVEMNTSLKMAEKKLKNMAYHDTLTGLANRKLLEISFDLALKYAQRNNKKIAVFFFDVDKFKSINDQLGHDAGDQLLKILALRLQDSVRKTDIAARIGGDEFLLILTDVENVEGIKSAAERIYASISAPIMLHGNEIYATASMGISVYPQDGNDLPTLLQCADEALYEAKADQRCQYRFYSPAGVAL